MPYFVPPEIAQWLLQYGYFALFALLALGIICLPVPDESLMILAGYLISKNTWPLIPTALAAISGSICGITISYILGYTAGHFLIKRYSHWIGMTQTKIEYVQQWFNKIGKWALFVGYFIVGVRHFTGYVAGMALLPFRIFALYAYSGAILWAATFLSLGYFLSAQLETVFQLLHVNKLLIAIAALLLLYLCWHVAKKRKKI